MTWGRKAIEQILSLLCSQNSSTKKIIRLMLRAERRWKCTINQLKKWRNRLHKKICYAAFNPSSQNFFPSVFNVLFKKSIFNLDSCIFLSGRSDSAGVEKDSSCLKLIASIESWRKILDGNWQPNVEIVWQRVEKDIKGCCVRLNGTTDKSHIAWWCAIREISNI